MSNIRISQSENTDLNVIVGKCQNSKINKLIEDINKNIVQRDIVLLLIDIAERPEICIDYKISISYYLALYMKCKEEPVLSEAGCLILNAAKIYARRIDNIHDCLQNTLASFENVSTKIDDINKSNEITNTKPKKINKRTLPQHDYLQEYDLCPKKFKLSTDEKLYEKEISLGSFEPPKRYFSDVIRYKEWRTNKKRKSNENMNEYFIDPNLWKYSTIEDFDYEDDIDTKRNYQIFTHIIEHRYNTLKNDINFVMHFKVKDFVEAEEEHDDPTKELSSFCKNSKNLSENFRNYIELENTILESEFRDCDNNSTLISLDFRHKRRKGNDNNIILMKDKQLGNNTTDLVETEVQNSEEINLLNATDVISDMSRTTDTTANLSTSIEQSISESTVPETQTTLNKENSINQSSVPDYTGNDAILSDNNATENSLSNTENFDPETIIVRLSMDDEGIFLSELDDVDRAMLNPRVVATDILKSMEHDISDVPTLRVTVDEKFEKFFGIDESDKNLTENLSGNNTSKLIELKLNFLKIPEKILRKRIAFRLSNEYDIYKKDRTKGRSSKVKPPRTIKLFKLNEVFTEENNPSQSPEHEIDFLGFTEEDINYPTYRNNLEKIRKSIDKFRTLSLDSGIESPETSSNKISIGNVNSVAEKISNSNTVIIAEEINNTNIGNTTADNSQIELNTNLLCSTLNTSDVESNNFTDSGISSAIENIDSINVSNVQTENLSESHTQINDMIQKIQQWHRHLKPILAQSKNRHHFDVFEIGTEIINHFPKENPLPCNKSINFTDVMKNKDPSYISRYFLSMLLLANTSNISINIRNEDKDQPCDSDNIQVQLLSRKRHTISVEDNIGSFNSKRICSTQESVLFPKPNQNIRINKINCLNDDNDSGFYSETSFATLS